MDNLRYRRSLELMEADIGDELVALDPLEGSCFGFNSVATTVWKALEQPQDLQSLQTMLTREYAVDPEQCSAELSQLLDDMRAKGLIEPAA